MVVVYAALAVLPLLVMWARTLAGWVRDFGQLVLFAGAGAATLQYGATGLQAFAAAGLALAFYTIYEWVTASSDAAKTTVISRHTGRRLPPL